MSTHFFCESQYSAGSLNYPARLPRFRPLSDLFDQTVLFFGHFLIYPAGSPRFSTSLLFIWPFHSSYGQFFNLYGPFHSLYSPFSNLYGPLHQFISHFTNFMSHPLPTLQYLKVFPPPVAYYI